MTTLLWDKGLVYHDLVRVLKDVSTEEKPLRIEKSIVERRFEFNRQFEQYIFEVEHLNKREDLRPEQKLEIVDSYKMSIPATVKELRKNYRKGV